MTEYKFGIQYEIIISKPLDIYFDILKINRDTGIKIKFVTKDNLHKIIIVPYICFESQIFENTKFKNYINEVKNVLHSNICDNISNNILEDLKNLKYYMTFFYSKYIKHNNIPKTNNDKENILENIKYKIFENDDYLYEIKCIESDLLNIVSLNESQKVMIEKISKHPKIKNIILYNGMNLYFESYNKTSYDLNTFDKNLNDTCY